MAVKAMDGSHHHSASRAKLHDQNAAAGKAGGAPKVKQMQPTGGDAAAAGKGYPEPTQTPIEDHVNEHGPAHAMVHEHEPSTNTHHVSTFHADAKMGDNDHPASHHSRHKSHKAAHDHMGKAMGFDKEDTEETPDEAATDTGSDEEDAAEGSGVPGLS